MAKSKAKAPASDAGATPAKTPPDQPKKRRATLGSWKAGQSGNPKGRPRKGESLSEVVRTEASPKAIIKRMQHLADHAESETVRYHALNWLSERGYGKAPQEVVFTEKNPYAKKVRGLGIAQLEIIAQLDDEMFELEAGAGDEKPDDGPSGVN